MSPLLRTNSIALFAVLVMLSAAVRAQETPAAEEADALWVYRSNNIPVMDLANVLQRTTDNRRITIVPEQISNVLIVRGAEADLQGLSELVEQLDRPMPRIMFSLTVLEVDEMVNVEDADPAALLEQLTEEHPEARIREIRLTSLENQMAQVQLGEQRPVVSGVSSGSDGSRINSYQYQQFGTILSVTARVGEERQVAANLSFEMSRLDESIEAAASADDVVPPATRTVTLQTTVSIPEGKMVLLTDFDSQDSPGQTRLIGFLTATIE